MRILFVLPAPVRVPMGGAAVVYQHAGGLSQRGHEVTIAAPQGDKSLLAAPRRAAVRARNAFHGVANRGPLAPSGVRVVEPVGWQGIEPASFDAVIATGYQTASWVTSLTEERGFYFLQHDERHLRAQAGKTWSLPLVRIAVSNWVAGTVRDAGYPVAGVVPNAIDPKRFWLDSPVEERPERVVALYHRLRSKGPDVLVDALNELKRLRPGVQATVISARPPRHRFPHWVDIEVRPTASRLRTIYNTSAVCLHTSRTEGWGLVPMEAAACGCAVVATDSHGPTEYLTPDNSVIVVPVGDGREVARQAARLMRRPSLRVDFARQAVADVSRFSWDKSTDAFEKILIEHTS